ncbi:MAG: cation:proton antiporter [Chloroflexota bacterium]|nr:cation:proton antiporter [Chloroflexota bacterium]
MEHLPAILFQLFALLLATKLGDELFKRLGQPALVGEILGGLVVGPAVLGWYQITPETSLFSEIGAVLLLFQVGVHTRVGEVARVGGTSLAVAFLGVALPFAGGYLLAGALDLSEVGRVFFAVTLTATSVGITSGALRGFGALSTMSGRVILGAAVIDDVLAMLIVTVAVGISAGDVSPARLALLFGLAVAFILIVVVGGTGILRRRRSLLTDPRFAETPFLPGMILMLGLAALAAQIGLAAIIGAFLAGMVVGESSEREALESETAPVAAFFTPFFFGFVGAQVDPAAFGSLPTVGLVVAVTLLAITAKFAGAFLGAIRLGGPRAALIAWGMVPRGEVEIIVAGLALTAGAFDKTMYAVVVGMVVATAIIVPPLMGPLVARAEPGVSPRAQAGAAELE